MSTHILKLVPVNRDYLPSQETHEKALDMLFELTDGHEPEVRVHNEVTFIDQGQKIFTIICPLCSAKTKVNYLIENDPGATLWTDIDEKLQGQTASSIIITTLCCRKAVPFTSFQFHWPAAFSHFELKINDPDLPEGLLDKESLSKIENILGCELLQIRAKY